jgi:predicted RNase H-like HicB family nuclease
MKTIEAIIERATDGTYSVYCINEMFAGMGNTAEEAKNDMIHQMEFYKKTAVESKIVYPEFLDSEFEIVYKFDTKSLLKFYSGILTLSGMEKLTGINQKQLWSYFHGKSTPRKAQSEKIETALHNLGNELKSISL